MHHFEQPARRRVVRKSVECCDFCRISGGPQVKLAFQRSWNSRKQSGAVLNSYVFAESKVRAPTVSNCFPLHFQKKGDWVCAGFFFGSKMADYFFLAWSRRAAPDCFRLFQLLWKASFTCGPLIQQKSQHSTLFLTTLLRAGCSKWCILTLKPNIP